MRILFFTSVSYIRLKFHICDRRYMNDVANPIHHHVSSIAEIERRFSMSRADVIMKKNGFPPIIRVSIGGVHCMSDVEFLGTDGTFDVNEEPRRYTVL
jgi:hypothetical protein